MVKKLLSTISFEIAQKFSSALRKQMLLAAFVLVSFSSYSQTTLFADINKTGSASLEGSVNDLVHANGLVFFVNDNKVWRSDGTTAGTYPLVDEQTPLSNIRELTSCGDRIYFVANYYGADKLWVSYGNYATVSDGGGMTFPQSPQNLVNANGTLYFSATDPTYGREVWKAFGGYRDVERISDILRGGGSSNPSEFENVNGTVFFSANDAINGYELWKTNGTPESTVLVKDVRTGSRLSSTPRYLTNVNGTLYFIAYDPAYGRELWKSNGTAAGTVLVKDIRPGTGESIPDNLTAVGSTLYFGANDGVAGRELWKSDGTSSGTVLVKDITPGPGSFSGGGYPHLWSFTVFNGTLYFIAYTDRPRIWKTDGTSAGTIPISPLDRHLVGIDPNLTVFNGALYYVSNDNFDPDRGTMEIWKTNGTLANHEQVRSNLGVWQNPDMELTAAGSRMYFTTWDGGTEEQLWYTDGTNAGTVRVPVESNTGSSAPSNLTTMGAAVYFSATNGIEAGLFKTDGTAGVQLVKAITGELSHFYTANSLLYFIQYQSTTNTATLWRSDGQAAGTYALKTVSTSPGSNRVYNYDVINSGIVFISFEKQLWRTNGTSEGTFQLKTFPNDIGWIANSNEELLFAANDGVRGMELWRSNGTVAGTVLQRDIWTGSASALLSDSHSEPQINAAVTLNGVVYFVANAGGDTNYELWRSDGTGGAGTRMLKNDETGIPFNLLNGVYSANGKLFMFTYEGAQSGTTIEKRTLWTSDGTTTGTVPVYELLHDEGYGMLNIHMIDGGAHFYFLTTVYLEPATLYASDGTTAGTTIVWEFGDMESAGPIHTAYDGQKTYISSGHMYDKFVLRSDGTACGTNVVPAYDEAYSVDVKDYWLAVLNHKLYLPSETEQFGNELYRYEDTNYAPCAATVAQSTATEMVIAQEENITTYPNPFASTISINVSGEEGKNYSLEVITTNGVVVEQRNDLLFNTSYDFGSAWKPGLYVARIKNGKLVTVKKIVKE